VIFRYFCADRRSWVTSAAGAGRLRSRKKLRALAVHSGPPAPWARQHQGAGAARFGDLPRDWAQKKAREPFRGSVIRSCPSLMSLRGRIDPVRIWPGSGPSRRAEAAGDPYRVAGPRRGTAEGGKRHAAMPAIGETVATGRSPNRPRQKLPHSPLTPTLETVTLGAGRACIGRNFFDSMFSHCGAGRRLCGHGSREVIQTGVIRRRWGPRGVDIARRNRSTGGGISRKRFSRGHTRTSASPSRTAR